MVRCGVSDPEQYEQGIYSGKTLVRGYEPKQDEESIYERGARFLSLNRGNKSVLYMGAGGEESGMGCQSLMG